MTRRPPPAPQRVPGLACPLSLSLSLLQVDVIYALSQAWCTSQTEADFDQMVKYLMDLKPEERILVGGWAEALGAPRGESLRASLGVGCGMGGCVSSQRCLQRQAIRMTGDPACCLQRTRRRGT